MGGKSSRTKGHSFERAVARVLRVNFPDARRGKQSTGGREADVEGTPFRIECKRQKTVTMGDVRRALQQAQGDAYNWEDDRPIIAITKGDRQEPLVTMTMHTAQRIVEQFFWADSDTEIEIEDSSDR